MRFNLIYKKDSPTFIHVSDLTKYYRCCKVTGLRNFPVFFKMNIYLLFLMNTQISTQTNLCSEKLNCNSRLTLQQLVPTHERSE